MAYIVTTELGHEVAAEDWRSFQRDRLLSALVGMKDLGVPVPMMEVSLVSGITGLQRAAAQSLAELMTSQGYLMRSGRGWALAPQGELWVRQSPSRRA